MDRAALDFVDSLGMARHVCTTDQHLAGSSECDRGVSATQDDLPICDELKTLLVSVYGDPPRPLLLGLHYRPNQDRSGRIRPLEEEGNFATNGLTAQDDHCPGANRVVLWITCEVHEGHAIPSKAHEGADDDTIQASWRADRFTELLDLRDITHSRAPTESARICFHGGALYSTDLCFKPGSSPN